MLKYKQIWYGIKPIRWLNKFNLTGINDVIIPNAFLQSLDRVYFMIKKIYNQKTFEITFKKKKIYWIRWILNDFY